MMIEQSVASQATSPVTHGPKGPFDYVAIKAVNWSTLKLVATSPLLCQYRAERAAADRPPLRLGRRLHVATLEPERWLTDFVIEPDFGPQYTTKGELATNPRATKGFKEAFATWQRSLRPGVEILEPDEHALITRCAASIRAHKKVAPLLKSGRTEQTIVWIDPVTGLKCKGRIDLLEEQVVDLKGTHRQTVRDFLNDATRFLYYAQLAWYHNGAILAGALKPDAEFPYMIGVQTVEPYDVIPVRMLPETYEAGCNLYRSLLDRYAQCQTAGWWPGLAEDFVLWGLPNYAPGVEVDEPLPEDDW